MDWVFNDGGRADAGFKGLTGDCGVRAISITTGAPYKEVYDAVNALAKNEKPSKRRRGKSNARTGLHKEIVKQYMEAQGWTWTPTMFIGQGCKVHLKADELPTGKLLVFVSKHYTSVIDGVLHDTFNCSRGGTRCVYGYFHKRR